MTTEEKVAKVKELKGEYNVPPNVQEGIRGQLAQIHPPEEGDQFQLDVSPAVPQMADIPRRLPINYQGPVPYPAPPSPPPQFQYSPEIEQMRQRANQFEQQANTPPNPYAGMSPLRSGITHALRSFTAGYDPNFLPLEAASNRAAAQEKLERAKYYRSQADTQMQRETEQQWYQAGERHQQALEAQAAENARAEAEYRAGMLNKPTEVGGRLVSPQGKVLYEPPPQVPAMDKIEVTEDGRLLEDYFPKGGDPNKPTYRKDRGPAPIRNTGVLSAYGESNIVDRLTKQWEKASKDVTDLYRANTIMQSGLEAARKGDMNAGSQAVLVTFQKFLDPQSVVRESEYFRSAQGQSLLARAQGAYERLVTGGAGVPLPELEAFGRLAQEINNNLAHEGTSLLAKQHERIARNAQHYQIPEDLIFSGYNFAQNPVQANQQPAAGQFTVTDPRGKVHTFATQAQADTFKQRISAK